MSLVSLAGPRRWFGLGCVLVLAAVLAGCSSSSSSSSSESSPAASAPASGSPESTPGGLMSAADAALVHARVLAEEKRPTSIGITEKVNRVPAGKTMYFVSTANPSSVQAVQAMQAAVTAIGHGWRLKDLEITPTPQAYQDALNVAIAGGASAIVLSSATESEVTAQLTQAKARHIPVFNDDSSSLTDSQLITVSGPQALTQAGTDEADYVLDKTGGKVTPLLLPIQAFAATALLAQGFSTEWKKMCPACATPQVLNLPASSLGGNLPSLVTAYLVAHRDIDYLVPALSDMVAGLPQALKSAGFGSLRAVTWAESPQSDTLLAAGTFLDAEVAGPIYEIPWADADAALRAFNGQPATPDEDLAGPDSSLRWIITKQGLSQAGLDPATFFPVAAGYQSQFKALWDAS